MENVSERLSDDEEALRVGIELPTVEVRFEHLNVDTETYVGKRALPSFINFPINTIDGFLNYLHILPSKKKHLTILDDVSGIIKPCRLTLILGPPSSGKTTLLLALAGKLDRGLKFCGRVTYNGHGLDEFIPERTAAYVSEHDAHIKEMTVRETLDFSAKCQGVGWRYELLAELSRREKEANIKPDPDIDVFMKAAATEGQETSVVTDYVLKILGLEVCANTVIGDEITRGISGGQRKRVTTGVHVLLLIFVNQMGAALFQAIAATSRSLIIADTFGSFVLLMLFGLGGFLLSKDEIKKWWIWVYWSSPLMYYQNAILVNEFLSDQWCHLEPNGTRSLGVAVLESRGFFTKSYWYWIGFGAVVVYTIIFNVLYVLALTFLNQFGKSQAVVLFEDSESDDQDGKTREAISSNQGRNNSGSQMHIEGGRRNQNKKRGMVLPFEPHSVIFKDIIYSVDMPLEMKNEGIIEDKLVLLKGLSGTFRPGVLTALMGVSGAGKTTLMDVLAGRKNNGHVEGNFKISGYPKNQRTFGRILGYCEQNDIHSPHVTIYESLLYSAWLRLPAEVDTKTRETFIEEVLELAELNMLRDALVGLPGVNGLSTEQRKRLTIAVELVANPSVIFMDEPTSGLDSRAAAIVMRAVRNAADTGRTVLFLMKRGGEEIYVGPLGRHCSTLIQYFEAIEGVSKIKEGYNPATWMLEVSSLDQEMALGVDFADIFKNSDLYRMSRELIEELSAPAPGSKDLHFPTQYATSLVTQCIVCLWKQRCSYWQNASYTCVRFFFTLFVALMFGTLFWNLGGQRNTPKDLLNAMGSMYAAVFFIGVHNGSSVRKVVWIERLVYYREKAAGMYSAFPYTFAQVMIEIPYIFCQATVYSVIVYTMIGFEWTVEKFLWYLFFTLFAMLYFTSYAMMVVAAIPNLEVATTVSSAFYGLWNLFSGLHSPIHSWTIYCLLVSQYGDVTEKFDCSTEETVREFLRRYFAYRYDFLGVVASVNVVFAVVFPLIFALLIKELNFQKR
ncbi:ABC transporter-like [Parasponia andersonii]|uniref:ABC transporter-like n=1 Tax=Parasponia andersonii TaxID=3476 RepID=A0A2P5A7Q5_PARAD|nr:ABC transporter-like [Parasponia andersonii]